MLTPPTRIKHDVSFNDSHQNPRLFSLSIKGLAFSTLEHHPHIVWFSRKQRKSPITKANSFVLLGDLKAGRRSDYGRPEDGNLKHLLGFRYFNIIATVAWGINLIQTNAELPHLLSCEREEITWYPRIRGNQKSRTTIKEPKLLRSHQPNMYVCQQDILIYIYYIKAVSSNKLMLQNPCSSFVIWCITITGSIKGS
ncbi:hypothetical protein YC2023_064394 [Brassica napus]